MAERHALPLTFIFRREGNAWAALACEIHVASCGDSLDHAREMLREVIELSADHLARQGRIEDLPHPTSADVLAEYFAPPREDLVVEYHALLVTIEGSAPLVPAFEFVRSMVEPICCAYPVPA